MSVAYLKCFAAVCTIECAMVNIGEGNVYVTCIKGFVLHVYFQNIPDFSANVQNLILVSKGFLRKIRK